MDFLIDKVIYLKAVSVFETLPEASLLDIARIMEDEEISKGTQFITKGDAASEMYIIKAGKVKVHAGDSTFATLGSGEIVGELALLSPVPRTASVTALENTLVYTIGREYFMDLMYEKPELMSNIMDVLTNRIISLNDELRSLKS